MAIYQISVTWDTKITNLYKDITLIQQGISAKLNVSLRNISRVTVNYKVGNEYFTDLCEIDLENNKVIVPFKPSVLEVGTHQLELVCHMKNGDVLPTPTYSYTVTKSLTNDNDITEEDAYPVLIGMIQELIVKENIIQANEEARANAEMYRELYEDERQNAEAERKVNENIRISNEDIRQLNESNRQWNENSREEYEDTRRTNENNRLINEATRENAENVRIANEEQRQTNEQARVTAENSRAEFYEGFNEQLAYKINNELFYDIKTEKFRHSNGTDYYITEIPFSIKPKIGIAKGGVGNVQSTLEFAREQRASLCINAGIFNMQTNIPQGSLMINGVIFTDEIYTNTTSAEILVIDDNGMLASFDSNNYTATLLMNEGYNNCVQGWYPFIKDGEYMDNRSTTDYQPLQAIGQKTNGDYVIFSCDGRTHYDRGMSIPEAAEVLLSYDVVYAYNLDGGGSVSTVNKLIKQNKNIDNMVDDRLVSTFIYFEKETVDNDVFDAFEEIARLKQEINEKLVEFKNIEEGYIRLKGKSGFYYPGIEFYQNNENTRLGKVELSRDNNFKVVYDNGTGEKEVLKAKLDGLYDVNGKLGDFHRVPTLITDCNTVRGSGIFRTNSSTLNTPVVEPQGYLINLDYDNDDNANIVQIFIAKETLVLGYRVIYAGGSTSLWMNYSNLYSSTRPTNDKLLKGFTMFDSNINKLIIYKGDGVWVDCNGTTV